MADDQESDPGSQELYCCAKMAPQLSKPRTWLALLVLICLTVLAIIWYPFPIGITRSLNGSSTAAPSLNASPSRHGTTLPRWLLKTVSSVGNPFTGFFDKTDSRQPFNESRLPAAKTLNQWEEALLAESSSNLAITYWMHWRGYNWTRRGKDVTSCGAVQLTDPYSLQHQNVYWQRFSEDNETVSMFLYNAYYDDRMETKVVRLLTMHRQGNPGRKWWCLFWFSHFKVPILVPASDYFDLYDGDITLGAFHPQLITCPVPESMGTVPKAVSLQSHGNCTQVEQVPSNVLRVINLPKSGRKQSSIGVCVKALADGITEKSTRLVEFLELTRLMGAEKVYFYVKSTTQKMMQVLENYQEEGLVQIRGSTLPGDLPNLSALYAQVSSKVVDLLELTDCLYQNRQAHEFLAVLDFEEMILPQRLDNWTQLLAGVVNDPVSRNKDYFTSICSLVSSRIEETEHVPSGDHIPWYLYTMRHTYRHLTCTESGRSFVRTSAVDSLALDMPMRCITSVGHRSCADYQIDPSISLAMLYGRQSNSTVEYAIEDRTIWKHLNVLKERVEYKFKQIFLN